MLILLMTILWFSDVIPEWDNEYGHPMNIRRFLCDNIGKEFVNWKIIGGRYREVGVDIFDPCDIIVFKLKLNLNTL
jgi:hypothetical protein